MTEIVQLIPARLKNISIDGHVAGTEDIVDDVKGMTQQEINSSVEDAIGDDETEGTILGRIKALEEAGPSTGSVEKVKVGDTEYSPVDGTVSLPAYPTTLPASDVYDWAKAASKPSYTKGEVGLGNVTNDAQVKRSEMGATSGVATLDSAGKVPSSQLPSYVDDVLEYDTKSAFPTTGEAGKIYVDKSTNTSWRWSGTTYVQIKGDLVIGTTTGTAADGGVANTHYNNTLNPHSVTKAQVGLGSVVNTGDSATPVSGGTTKFTTGGAYTELNKKVDKVDGKGLSTNDYTTDEKNKLAGIAAGAEVNVQSDWNATSGDAFIKNKPTIPSEVTESTVSGWGFTKNAGTITGIKMNGSSKGTSGVVDLGTVITAHQDISGKVDKTTTVNNHALSGNVSVTKSDVGLGNVGNFKAVSTVASQGLTDTEKSNARANIGAGTSSFSGSYNDLSGKPTIPAAAANGTYTVKTLVGSTTTNVSDFTANQNSADDVTFVQGSNVTITPDATNRKITIAATDTKNTAGTTNKTGTKMFLAAATSQAANPQTYSNSSCYIGTDNCLYSGGAKVLTAHDGNNRKAFYGTCTTAAATKDKVVTLAESAGWPGLVAGVIVGVKFTNTNSYDNETASPITLNVNSTGAKNIWYGTTHSGAGNTGANTTAYGRANYVNYYMYDGTYWVWMSSSSDNNTTYSAGTAALLEAGTNTTNRVWQAKIISDYVKDIAYTLTRHIRLFDFDLNVLKQAVKDQNLEKHGLKVGDQKTINGRTYVIAGLNCMYGTTSRMVTYDHVGLIVIPHVRKEWNASGNTYTGASGRGEGYANCDLHYYLHNTLLPLVKSDLGADNVINHSKFLTSSINLTGTNRYGTATGCANSCTWVQSEGISALTEVQVLGSTVFSGSGYDTGEACHQLDVFKNYSFTEIFGTEFIWLRDIASKDAASFLDNDGIASGSVASNQNYVAALVLFK